MGKLESALSDLAVAQEISPEDPHPLELRSTVWKAMGKTERAAADKAKAESLRQHQ